jgi:hypothetical protein
MELFKISQSSGYIIPSIITLRFYLERGLEEGKNWLFFQPITRKSECFSRNENFLSYWINHKVHTLISSLFLFWCYCVKKFCHFELLNKFTSTIPAFDFFFFRKSFYSLLQRQHCDIFVLVNRIIFVCNCMKSNLMKYDHSVFMVKGELFITLCQLLIQILASKLQFAFHWYFILFWLKQSCNFLMQNLNHAK